MKIPISRPPYFLSPNEKVQKETPKQGKAPQVQLVTCGAYCPYFEMRGVALGKQGARPTDQVK